MCLILKFVNIANVLIRISKHPMGFNLLYASKYVCSDCNNNLVRGSVTMNVKISPLAIECELQHSLLITKLIAIKPMH